MEKDGKGILWMCDVLLCAEFALLSIEFLCKPKLYNLCDLVRSPSGHQCAFWTLVEACCVQHEASCAQKLALQLAPRGLGRTALRNTNRLMPCMRLVRFTSNSITLHHDFFRTQPLLLYFNPLPVTFFLPPVRPSISKVFRGRGPPEGGFVFRRFDRRGGCRAPENSRGD